MPYIFLLLFTLLFTTACNNSAIVPNVQSDIPPELPMSTQTRDDDNSIKIIPENTIIGEYTLQHGIYSNEAIHQEVNEGYLIIEELDANNYGYYYATIINGLAETYLGIFFKKDGKFVQKVIYDNAGKSKIAIQDNINVKLDGNILKIVIDDAKHQVMLWNRDDGTATKSDKLKEALKQAKKEYLDFYKRKCEIAEVKCSEREYTPVDE